MNVKKVMWLMVWHCSASEDVAGSMSFHIVFVDGDLGQVAELVRHLLLELRGLQRVVHGDMLVHKKHSGKADLYIS